MEKTTPAPVVKNVARPSHVPAQPVKSVENKTVRKTAARVADNPTQAVRAAKLADNHRVSVVKGARNQSVETVV